MHRQVRASSVTRLEPAAPTPPAVPGTQGGSAGPAIAGQPVAPTPSTELQKLSYQQLRARWNELKGQRSELAGRREALASNYERATGANQAGMGARLTTLYNNIVSYEMEIAAVGKEMAVKAPTRPQFTGSPSGGNNPFNEGDMAGAVFGTFFTTTVLLFFFMRRFVRRNYSRMPMSSQPNTIQSNERLERIEQAVDTIAVEIERVSENQRFMTRLMTETQLGASLNDVRKSTELAKEAVG